jgi:hypothetical protein
MQKTHRAIHFINAGNYYVSPHARALSRVSFFLYGDVAEIAIMDQ